MMLPLLLAVSAALAATPGAAFTHAPPPWSSRVARHVAPPPEQPQQDIQQREEHNWVAGHVSQVRKHIADQVELQLRHLRRVQAGHWLQTAEQPQPQQQPQPQPQTVPNDDNSRDADEDPNSCRNSSEETTTAGPPAAREDETRPEDLQVEVGTPKEVRPPSNCVLAIVTCCQPQTAAVRYSCFELLGCTGAFWDGSPCEDDVAAAALRHVSKFYERPSPSSPPS